MRSLPYLKRLCAWLWTGALVFLLGWQMAHAPNQVPILRGLGYVALATVTLWEVKKRFSEDPIDNSPLV